MQKTNLRFGAETDKAVLVLNKYKMETWLPKSKIQIEGHTVTAVENWLVEQKQLKIEPEQQEIKSTQEEATKMEKTSSEIKMALMVDVETMETSKPTGMLITPKKSHKRNIYRQKKAGTWQIYFKGNTYQFTAWADSGAVIDLKWISNSDGFEENELDDFETTENTTKTTEALQSEYPVHAEYDTIRACIENDVPVYLVGPAGSGKNHILQQVAGELFLDFYFTNAVQQEYKLTGFIDAGGKYHETEFFKAFKNGGLFFLDEMDASIPEVLVLLNAAIANRYFDFPTGKIDAHDNFRVVAAGNTVGDGADEQYTGRLTLDQASLDRFVIINFDYDRNIELAIAKGNVELVNFVNEIRANCKSVGIRATFSYRAIISVTKLEKTLPLQKVLLIAVAKGIDKDTLKTIPVGDYSNKYWRNFKELQF